MDSTAGPFDKEPIPEALRWAVWERDNFTCHYCGSRRYLSLDHIIPESQGGETSKPNLVTCCTRCNSRKGTGDYYGFLLQQIAAGCSWKVIVDAVFLSSLRRRQAQLDLARLSTILDLRQEFPLSGTPLEALQAKDHANA